MESSLNRPPLTYDQLMKVFEHSHVLVKSIVLSVFVSKREAAHAFLERLMVDIASDEYGSEQAKKDTIDGLRDLLNASEKCTDEERDFISRKIKQEFNIKSL